MEQGRPPSHPANLPPLLFRSSQNCGPFVFAVCPRAVTTGIKCLVCLPLEALRKQSGGQRRGSYTLFWGTCCTMQSASISCLPPRRKSWLTRAFQRVVYCPIWLQLNADVILSWRAYREADMRCVSNFTIFRKLQCSS